MNRRHAGHAFALVVCATSLSLAGLAPVVAGAEALPVVIHQGVVTRQDIASQPGSETDTVVEPDVAVSPINKNVAIAAAHDSRFPDGGAVDISVAWTIDAGATWHHMPVKGITTATGGPYDRASVPVVAFAADGTAYLSVLVFDATSCPTAVAVLRSTDGGQKWSKPSYAHKSAPCDYSDDKKTGSWWTPRRPVRTWAGSTSSGHPSGTTATSSSGRRRLCGGPTTARRRGADTHYVTPIDRSTQNSQPMILPDGSIVDTYYDFGPGKTPDGSPQVQPEAPRARLHQAVTDGPIDAAGTIYATTSKDGGVTWSHRSEVANNAAGYADGVRCCLFAADIDAVTHVMYAAWEGGVGTTDPVPTSPLH